MPSARDENLPSWDAEGGGDPQEDPGLKIEALMERADRPYASESFGTTAGEEEEGESLDRRLAEERPDRRDDSPGVFLEDDAGADNEGELVGEASADRDSFVSPEEAAMTIRRRAPGGVDHDEDNLENDPRGE